MSTKYTVIIPAYNVEKIIEETIKSVTSQLKSNYEIIVVDDGSYDNTVSVIENIQKNNKLIKLYRQSNGGPSKARNLGLEKATGKYIIFLDADDSLTANCFDFIQKIQLDYNISTVVHNAYGILPSGNKFTLYNGIMIPGNDGIYSNKCAALPFLVNIWLCCFDASIIKNNNIRFNEQLSYGEDWLFMNQYLCACEKFYWTNNCLYNYTVNDSNSLSSVTDIRCIHVFDGFNLCVKNFEKYNLWDTHKFAHYLKFIFHCMWFYDNKLKFSSLFSEINQLFRLKILELCKEVSSPFLYALASHLSLHEKLTLKAIINKDFIKLYRLKIKSVPNVERSIFKLKKHIKSFFNPIVLVLKWFGEIFSILYYAIKSMLEITKNIKQ